MPTLNNLHVKYQKRLKATKLRYVYLQHGKG